MDNPQPVRYRVVLELTFSDADPWDPSDHGKFLDAMKEVLENAPTVKCRDVLLREFETIAADDNDDNWRARRKRLRKP